MNKSSKNEREMEWKMFNLKLSSFYGIGHGILVWDASVRLQKFPAFLQIKLHLLVLELMNQEMVLPPPLRIF